MSEKQTRITGESERNITFTFDVNEILGRGGFGVVFRGTWGNGVEVQLAAVKRVQLIDIQDSDRHEENMKNLFHANVVKLLDVTDRGDFRCI